MINTVGSAKTNTIITRSPPHLDLQGMISTIAMRVIKEEREGGRVLAEAEQITPVTTTRPLRPKLPKALDEVEDPDPTTQEGPVPFVEVARTGRKWAPDKDLVWDPGSNVGLLGLRFP